MSLRALVAASIAAAGLAHAGPASAPVPAASVPAVSPVPGSTTRGKITWYGRGFAGRPTASGEPYDPEALTMAHRTLPLGTRVRVTNTRNKRSVVLRVNDRGPSKPGRIGDVSRAAARLLGMLHAGVVEARLEVLGSADASPQEPG